MITHLKNLQHKLKRWELLQSGAEFKEFDRRFKFKPRFKYGWFHFKLYHMFQDKPALNLKTFGGFKPRLKFIKFHLRVYKPSNIIKLTP